MTRHTQHTHSLFSRWLLSHRRAFTFALTEFMRMPIANFITVCVIGIAIALPLGFFVLLQNLQFVDSTWSASAPTISLYLKSNTAQSDIDSMMQSLKANEEIAKVTYISPDQGLKTFEKNTPFSNVMQLFQNNPIPSVITVLPAPHYQNPTAINTLFSTLKALPFVDIAQLDMNWVTRLFDVITIGKKITNALSILFGIGVILIIGHTLRTSLSSHINEIQVMRLIGATNAYIRRPLLYRGILYGLLGGIIAWILINLFLSALQSPVSRLAQTYRAPFELHMISFSLGTTVLFFSILAGFISAFFITTQFLNQPEVMD
jgi:cell division transport system permease protein